MKFAQCARRPGEHFQLSVMIIGDCCAIHILYITNLYHIVVHVPIFYRRNIESAHGHEVERLRKEYTQEDKELIKKAKRIFNMRSGSLA